MKLNNKRNLNIQKLLCLTRVVNGDLVETLDWLAL